MQQCFVGIDVGTQGVRASLVTDTGEVLGEASRKFTLTPDSRMEQWPDDWWHSTLEVMDELHATLQAKAGTCYVAAIGVDSTSGTVIPLDRENRPLHPAIMYSDPRSAEVGRRVKTLAERYVSAGYTGFNASSGLSKMVWFVETYPEKVIQIHKWVHASDYITGMFCGRFDVTDYTNALKSGYDLTQLQWPGYLTDELPLPRNWLQQVVPSGTPVSGLCEALAVRWGMPQAQVVVGMTDGCASQVASGAVRPGEWNTTIGTTLVIKGVTEQTVNDPEGRLYSHRHPDGYWMPGGASNTGADWVTTDFDTDLQQLNEAAASLIPTGLLAWPLKQTGERFPFIAPKANGFVPTGISPTQRFAACMEGVAFIERMAYELIEQLSGERVAAVYTAGGGSNSDTWLRIRANVLACPIYKCRDANGAVGAAVVAASKTRFNSLVEATQAMTAIEQEVFPEQTLVNRYEIDYGRFVAEMKKKGYC
ncbi:MAG TPA: FGGY-family carbohydrate kinase [Parapedobacter sp.]|uniref:FGGY-family carbohydrate kinase n=1 Tax=Parapedobacter sp. TaxID=1958893 RepID=UPI002CEB7B0E|nr:FGGY-family carbohydrate kinase [Parapedobacter sp.]HWK56561.1 FGGY-family carbohydrate kinase [Parapedobacter sp.]